MKDDQKFNIFVGLGIFASLSIVTSFIAALIGSESGQVATALATLISGILALIAGFMVYRSAMASIDAAKDSEGKKERLRTLNLYLKAEHMAYILTQIASLQLTSARLAFSVIETDGQSDPGHVSAIELRIPRPRQLNELWDNLSEFPDNAIFEIRFITQCFDSADEYLKNNKSVPDGNKSPLAGYYSSIWESARVLAELMAASEPIRNHCIAIPDRNSILYGDPDDSDSQ